MALRVSRTFPLAFLPIVECFLQDCETWVDESKYILSFFLSRFGWMWTMDGCIVFTWFPSLPSFVHLGAGEGSTWMDVSYWDQWLGMLDGWFEDHMCTFSPSFHVWYGFGWRCKTHMGDLCSHMLAPLYSRGAYSLSRSHRQYIGYRNWDQIEIEFQSC